jgi:hypothetical protein
MPHLAPSALSLSLSLFLTSGASAQEPAGFDPARLDLSAASLQAIALPSAPVPGFRVALALGGSPVELSLNRHSLRAEGFELLVQGPGGALAHAVPEPVRTYRGGLDGVPGSRVAASLREDGLHALVLVGGELLFGIQPAPGAPGLHAVYDARAILPRDVTCGVPGGGPLELPATPGPAEGSGANNVVVTIGVDSDNQFFLDQGSSVPATQAEMEGILNGVEAIYDADVDVVFSLTSLIVRTVEPDPYTGDIFSRLDGVQSEWTNELAGMPRDITHLFTGLGVDAGVIGVAYLSAVCDFDFGFGVSDVEFTDNFGTKVGLTAHEIGHNFGANHCDGAPDCSIMCSFIGGCAPDLSSFGSQEKAEIVSFVSSAGCLTPPAACGISAFGLASGNTSSLAATGQAKPGTNLTLVYANPQSAPSTAFCAIADNAGSTPFGPGIVLVDVGSILAFTPGVTFSSVFAEETENVPIPNQPALVGNTFFVQAAHQQGGGSVTEFSNGVQLTICP